MTDLALGQLAEAIDAAVALLQDKRRIEESVLERVAGAMRCEWAAYWTLDPHSGQLQAISSWSALGSLGERFEQDTRVRSLAQHAGNAWHVWRTRRPIWANDLILEMCLPRSLRASEAGLRAGVWFGVQTERTLYGVIELLARALPYRRYETVMAVERAGFRLGMALDEMRHEPSKAH